jgi:hypothetical protein
MYKIIKDGVVVGITGAPTYIKMMDNGCFGLCSKEEAQGVAFDGVPYHLDGRAKMDGADTTSVVEDSDATVSRDHTAAAQVFVEQAEAGNVDAETASQHAGLFTAWAEGVAYTVGALRQYAGQLYKCIMAHTSQDDWTPDVAVSLWVKAHDPAEEWPTWVQPTGAHDAYAKDAKVSHMGKHWVSYVDSNTWEPSVYGWNEVTD